MSQVTRKLSHLLATHGFLRATLLFFGLESVWIALSARYPMAFDEDFHFGIIKIYSHHWLPFLGSQPAETSTFGAVARDPSYFYHYLMSFPYRLIELCTSSQTAQIIVLRLLNVMLFGLGLWLFHRLMLRVGASPLLSNVSLAFFVLIPIVPLLAGQINYDNLLMPVVAASCLLTLSIADGLRHKRLVLRDVVLLAALCLMGSIIKYAFLPIAFAIGVFLLWTAWRAVGWRALWPVVRDAYQRCTTTAKLWLLAALVVSFGLFAQRYVVNVLTYHAPIPDCAKVLSEDACMSYGPWARDYQYKQTKLDFAPNPLVYTPQWLEGLHYRLFFMISGPSNQYQNYPPLLLPSAAFVVLFVIGLLAIIFYARETFRGQSALAFLLLCSALYLTILWADNFAEYGRTGVVAAVNGRYLLPILLLLAAVAGRALTVAFRHFPRLGSVLLLVALLCFVDGGGVFSFMARSDSTWYWPNRAVTSVNTAAHNLVAPLVVRTPNEY
ncbi:MAG TPA: hypothetical protein VLF91_03870 [Candidatus Saccharimonadales bacterium]|nr:hypothetical protein [Candidatus Saccharimonadales bacterium]